ncbi:MAG: LysM peptidoglycan-binding domain-containing protein [Sulfurovum sp.]|nr:MAG: LysM peptidoglycan-binding domain-containing protein [Sulfurovum sp.]
MSVQLNLDVNDMVHIVQKGETLYGIAKIYKTTYQKLAEINEIAEPYTILEKQGIKVSIPRHTVKKGETLSSIAKVYGTTYQKLAEYNEISAPYSLKIGQVLNLIQVYDEQILILDSIDNMPIENWLILIQDEYGNFIFNRTDVNGLSALISDTKASKINVFSDIQLDVVVK